MLIMRETKMAFPFVSYDIFGISDGFECTYKLCEKRYKAFIFTLCLFSHKVYFPAYLTGFLSFPSLPSD